MTMTKTIVALLIASALAAGCAAQPQEYEFALPTILPRPYQIVPSVSDEEPPRQHSNKPMHLFFGTDGASIRLPSDRATRARVVDGVVILE